MLAASAGHLQVAKHLVEKYNCKVNEEDIEVSGSEGESVMKLWSGLRINFFSRYVRERFRLQISVSDWNEKGKGLGPVQQVARLAGPSVPPLWMEVI